MSVTSGPVKSVRNKRSRRGITGMKAQVHQSLPTHTSSMLTMLTTTENRTVSRLSTMNTAISVSTGNWVPGFSDWAQAVHLLRDPS